MYHPTTRVLTVLELLQAHDLISGRELARRLEVSERSVRHYVAQLQDLGIPVESELGRYGGYRLRPGFKLPPLMFTADEAVALTVGLLAARKTGLTIAAGAVEGALAKIERVLPDAVRHQIQAVQDTLILDGEAPYLPPASAVVRLISQAAQRRQRIRIRYRAWNDALSEREIDPYGVVHHAGRWFAAGHCHMRGDLRIFRLDRVLHATVEVATFQPPIGFDVLRHVIERLASAPGAWSVEVLLDTTVAAVRRTIPPSMALVEEHAEGVVLRCSVQSLDWIAYVLVGLECDLEVRQPVELRMALGRLAARIERLAGRQ